MPDLTPNYRKRSYLLPKGGKTHGLGLKAKPKTPETQVKVRINGQIKAESVEIIDEAGKTLGVVTLQKALEMARDNGVDLIALDGENNPRRCLLMDFGRFRFLCQNGSVPAKWQK